MLKGNNISNKQELEEKLVKVRSEIQWREREKKEMDKPKWWSYLIGLIWTGLFIASFMLTEKIDSTNISENYVLIWLINLIIFVPIYIIILNNTETGKKYKKNNEELGKLKKREKELREKLNN